MSEFKVFINVPVNGSCITRNGSANIGFMNALDEGDGNVRIGFVSSKLHRSLNAGVCLRVEDLDKFCEAWVKSRAKSLAISRPLNDQGVVTSVEDYDRLSADLEQIYNKLDEVKNSLFKMNE